MTKNIWVTKEMLFSELKDKSELEQKKAIKRMFNQNWIIYKNKIKTKAFIKPDFCLEEVRNIREEFEGKKYVFPEVSAEYTFLQEIKEKMLQRKEPIDIVNLFKALYYSINFGAYNNENLPLIKHLSFWLNEKMLNLLISFSELPIEEQNRILEIIAISSNKYKFPFIKLYKLSKSLKNTSDKTKKLIMNYLSFVEIINLDILNEVLISFQEEYYKNGEIFKIILMFITSSKITNIVKETDMILKSKKSIFKVSSEIIDKRLKKLDIELLAKKAIVEKSIRMDQEISNIMSTIENREIIEKKFLTLSNETIENMPVDDLIRILKILMDYNSLIYLELFTNQKSSKAYIPSITMEQSEIEARNYIKKYYSKGSLIVIPENIDEFTKALKNAKMSDLEIKEILKQVSFLLKKEKVDVEDVEIQHESEEQLENEIVYLKTDSGICYALKDIDYIPTEYYASFLELILSIKNNKFKNRKALVDISKILEVKNFKTRVIFARVGQNKYAILGMFLKKADKNNYHRSFLISRQEQFLRQQNLLKNTTNESEVTEMLINKLSSENLTLKLEKKDNKDTI